MAKGKNYSKDFKLTIVELKNHGKSYEELTSEYGIDKSTIAKWVNEYKSEVSSDNKIAKFDLKELDESTIALLSKEELATLLLEYKKEISLIKREINTKDKEINNVKEEAEILKKAIAIFTKK